MSNFTPAQIEDIKARYNVVDYAMRVSQLHKIAGSEWAGPCPKCSGRDRFHVHADGWWFCRSCQPKRRDVIGLEMFLTGATFPAACESLGARRDESPPPVERRKPEPKPQLWRTPEWQDAAERLINASVHRLEQPIGAAGRAYLERRGISMVTARHYLIGYSPTSPKWTSDNGKTWNKGGPALTLPYLRRTGENVQAVRYRRLNPDEPRYSNLKDSEPTLFGVVQAERGHVLVLIEGEFNGISVEQAAHDLGVSVASFGSQTLGPRTLKAVTYLSSEYSRVIVWCDEPEAARKVREAINVPCTMLESPKTQSQPKGYDANDLLVAGRLRSFMQRVIERRQAA